jgi:hypothetical protein
MYEVMKKEVVGNPKHREYREADRVCGKERRQIVQMIEQICITHRSRIDYRRFNIKHQERHYDRKNSIRKCLETTLI